MGCGDSPQFCAGRLVIRNRGEMDKKGRGMVMKVPEKELPKMLKMEAIEDEYTKRSTLNISRMSTKTSFEEYNFQEEDHLEM